MSGNMYKSHHLSCYKTDFLNTQNVYLKKNSYTFCNNNFLLSLHLKILICYLQSNRTMKTHINNTEIHIIKYAGHEEYHLHTFSDGWHIFVSPECCG